MIEKIRVGVAPEVENDSFFAWTNRKIEEIRAGLTGCPRIEVEVKDGWTWLVIDSGMNDMVKMTTTSDDTFTRTINEIERLGGANSVIRDSIRRLGLNIGKR